GFPVQIWYIHLIFLAYQRVMLLPSNNLAPSSNKSISLNRGDTAKDEMLFLYIKRPESHVAMTFGALMSNF
ncbi:hypothetical protein ACI3P6_10110, partial [Lacticaseibacillus paracasei]|uniref:hypothetical protein n=1 Tax=Lacticaseibacillus paracasei TaxID=1597 RepID=UPI003852B1D4